MPHTSQVRSRLPVAAGATVALFALALAGAALPTRAADTPPKPAIDATLKIKAFPRRFRSPRRPPPPKRATRGADERRQTRRVEAAGDRAGDRADDQLQPPLRHGRANSTRSYKRLPWVIGLIFLVVGSIFLRAPACFRSAVASCAACTR